MKELTDQELTNKIRQAFDGFEDPGADQGWEELRKKFPEEKRRPLLIWWWSAAAIFILCLCTWFLLPQRNQEDQNLAGRDKEIEQTFPKQHDIKDNEEDSLYTENQHYKSQNSINNDANHVAVSGKNRPDEVLIETDKPVSLEVYSNSSPKIAVVNQPVTDSTKVSETQILAGAAIDQKDPVPINNPVANTSENYAMTETKSPELRKEEPKKPTTNKKEKLGLSFYAGSYFNYSEGSDTKLNFGAGVSSDLKLGKNLRLSTGVSIAKNSLNYDGGLPSSSNSDKAYNSVAPPNTTINPPNLTLQTITSYNADLLSLDIPVNLKYLIIPEANKLYISAGLSSGTQINETYVYYYQNYSTASGFLSNEAKGDETKKQFQSFDLARTFNLSFGFSTRLSKTQHITIEPFLKYPLGGLGSENLRFGSSGINLKLNFNQLKNGK